MSGRRVADVLGKQEIATVPASATVREAGRLMTERNVGSVLVVDGEALLGIFTERDALRIFVATRRNADLTEVGEVMTRDPRTVTPDTPIEEAISLMNKGGYRHLPVVEGGRLLGVVSRRALLPGA